MKKTLIIAFTLVSISLVLAFSIYQKRLMSWVITSYFAERNIRVTFSLDRLNLSGISLSNIVFDDKVRVEKIHLHLRSAKFSLANIDFFSIRAKDLDINQVQKLMEKLSDEEEKGTTTPFALLHPLCQTLESLKIDLKVENIIFEQKNWPINFELQHQELTSPLSLKMKGRFDKSPLPSLFSLSRGNYEIESSIGCPPGNFTLSVPHFKGNLQSLKVDKKAIDIEALSWEITSGRLSLSKEDSLEFEWTSSLDLNGSYQKKGLHFSTPSQTMKGSINLRSLHIGELQIKGSDLSIQSPSKIELSGFYLKAQTKKEAFFPLQGDYEIKGGSLSGEGGEIISQGLEASGHFELTESLYRSSLNLKDKTGTLRFKDSQILYSPKTEKLKLRLNKRSSSMALNDQLGSLFPTLEKMEVTAQGKIQVLGSMAKAGENFKGNLRFSGKTIQFTSKHAQGDGIEFRHSLQAFPSMKSADNQVFKARELRYGPTIKNIHIKYKINQSEDIQVQLMEAQVEGTEIQAANFSVNAIERTTKDFEAAIYKLSLEKALKLALGDSVTAEGSLDGQIQIFFKGKKPMAKGHLQSSKKGWIRYRKPGSSPPKQEITSTNPMDILEAYLYDFYYDQLYIDFETDDQFDMKMTLRTQGQNPGYLKGKPLKLNINLEQNLLAAFKAMMLTYNLPHKIKEKIEEMGGQ